MPTMPTAMIGIATVADHNHQQDCNYQNNKDSWKKSAALTTTIKTSSPNKSTYW
jgi:hypothetical protein